MLRILAVATFVALAGEARGEQAPASFAVRAGWAYGLGAELEWRRGTWGLGASGGYVPQYGPGGYLGVQWGSAPLGASGFVAEAGVFRGIRNPLRTAPTGLGLHALGGYAFAPAERISIRVVAGGGLPFAGLPEAPSFEFLAKLTAGVVF